MNYAYPSLFCGMKRRDVLNGDLNGTKALNYSW